MSYLVDSDSLVHFILVGDSDIARWPESQFPSLSNNPVLKQRNYKQVISNYSQNGALLANIPSQVKRAYEDELITIESNKNYSCTIFIACAGENDLSAGFNVDSVMSSFHKLVDSIFSDKSSSLCQSRPHYLIFFGPKLEPWIDSYDDKGHDTTDTIMRKSYYQLSERMTLASTIKSKDDMNIAFIDCLTLFCDVDSASNDKGAAVLSGRYKALSKYFDHDGLHLNEEGYKVWKKALDLQLSQLLCKERCNDSLDMSRGKNMLLD